MTEGLTRRRGPTTPGAAHEPNPPPATVSRKPAAPIAGGGGGSGAVEGRAKVAYDPKDFEGEVEQVPRLTIMEEVLLLGLKDKAVSRRVDKLLTSKGYLSFWNDNISYALRGCILIELALRRRIAMVRDPSRRRLALSDRLIEVIDDRQTGETILDEALKMIKSSEKYGTGAWVDLMSGASSASSVTKKPRGDVERDEDRLSIEAGQREARKRSGGQGDSEDRKEEFPALRHGDTPDRGHECKGRRDAEDAVVAHREDRSSASPGSAQGECQVPAHASGRVGLRR